MRLVWDATAGTDHYVVRRGELRDFSDAAVVGSPDAPLFEDRDALRNAKTFFYSVSAVNPCGAETP